MKEQMKIPTLVIVGRPNVGKSSIFNRLIGRKKALVLDTPGVTRDRLEDFVTLYKDRRSCDFRLIDTGGLGPGNFSEEIKQQVELALTEADGILYVCDGRVGLTMEDKDIFLALRKSGALESKIIIGVVNKSDVAEREDWLDEFHELGLDHICALSAEHNLGTDELTSLIMDTLSPAVEGAEETEEEFAEVSDEDEDLEFSDDEDFDESDEDLEDFEDDSEEDEETEELDREKSDQEIAEPHKYGHKRIPHIAIVGQPNVGKSTLLNAICGHHRVVTSPIAGTTVDPIDTLIEWNGDSFVLIDTAGVRRRNKTEQGIEVLSVVQTIKTLERADLVFLVLDGEKGIADQDEKIAGLIEEAGCSVILVLNKWDTQLNNKEFKQGDAEEMIRKQIRFLGYAPLVFTTAINGMGVDRLFRMAKSVLDQREKRIPTNEVTAFIKAESEINNPFNAKVYMVRQLGQRPPRFVAHVNDPKKVHFSLHRHLVNALRAKYGYSGTPIRFALTKSSNTNK